MRLAIRHETQYVYERPATRAVETLRLTPPAFEAQHVAAWRIDIDHDCKLHAGRDPFGNKVHDFTAIGPLEQLTIVAEGTIETTDTDGVVGGLRDRLAPVVFLRDTPLTRADAALRALAVRLGRPAKGGEVAHLHKVMDAVREAVDFRVDATDTGTSAAEALKLGTGVCQDFAHIFIALARQMAIPARYVGGYLHSDAQAEPFAAGHAWAEALVDDLGWVGFDPANGVSPTDRYVRVAAGLDYLGAAPIRGTHYGGGGEEMSVRITVATASR